jgi:hypothetical protein
MVNLGGKAAFILHRPTERPISPECAGEIFRAQAKKKY